MPKVCSECGSDENHCVECGKVLKKGTLFYCFNDEHFCSDDCWKNHESMDLLDAEWVDEEGGKKCAI